jgi:hypothetical protein
MKRRSIPTMVRVKERVQRGGVAVCVTGVPPEVKAHPGLPRHGPSPPPLSHRGARGETLSPAWERVAEGRERGKAVIASASS